MVPCVLTELSHEPPGVRWHEAAGIPDHGYPEAQRYAAVEDGGHPIPAARKQERRGHDGHPVAGLGQSHQAVGVRALQGDTGTESPELECSVQDLSGCELAMQEE